MTTAPNKTMAKIHDRIPVILSSDDYDRWLDPTLTQHEDVEDLLRPFAGKMQNQVVSSAVNSPKNNGPELTMPVCTA